MKTKPFRILLTGGAGFIGSHVAEALLGRGAQLTIVDNLDPFYSPERKRLNLEEISHTGNFDLFETDICEPQAMREAMICARPDILIHLAARPGVGPSILDPRSYAHTNIAGTLNLLDLCRELKIPKFIFGSSSSVYGQHSPAPFSEEQADLRPISPYAATKLSGEILCQTYAHLFGLQVTCLRFFTAYGPRQRPDLAIHKFTALIEAGCPLPMHGNGSSGRDYTHIDDIVSGVLSALDYEPCGVDGIPFEIFNIGRSHPVRLNELIELLEHTIGRKGIRHPEAVHPGDPPLTWANISKANARLGYKPVISLEEGLREFVEWYRAAQGGLKQAVAS